MTTKQQARDQARLEKLQAKIDADIKHASAREVLRAAQTAYGAKLYAEAGRHAAEFVKLCGEMGTP